MSRDPNFHIPEIEAIEERKERYLEKIKNLFPGISELEIAILTGYMEMYAQEKIDQIFKEGNERIDKDLVDRRPIRLLDKEEIE